MNMFSSSPPNSSSPLPSSPAVNGGSVVGGGSYFTPQGANSASSSGTPSLAPASSPLPTATDTIPSLLQRRISTLTFLNHSLSGHANWLHSVRLGKRELEAAFPPETMRKRTTRFLLLGLALGPILEMNNLQEVCKTILSILSELDALQDAGEKDKKRNFNVFGTRSRILRRPTVGMSDFSPHDALGGSTGGVGGAGTASGSAEGCLLLPNVPFQLDYFQTFTTLCDMLVEVYSKLLTFVAPSAFSSPIPPAFFAPTSHGSVRSNATAGTNDTVFAASSMSGSLGPSSAYAHADLDDHPYSQSTLSVPSQYAQHLSPSIPQPPAPTLSNAQQDLLLKADSKLKKVIAQIVKELDSLARHLIKEELSSVESVLRRPSAPGMSQGSSSNGTPTSASAWPGLPPSSAGSAISALGGAGGFERSAAPSPAPASGRPGLQGRSVSDFGAFGQGAGVVE